MIAMPYERLFRRAPVASEEGVPRFCERDRYVQNYEKIAADHLAAIRGGVDNPFIEGGLWVQLEESTRTLIRRHVPAAGRVLDIGVGLGRVLGPFPLLDRYGIDISLGYLREARNAGFEVAFAKVEDLPYQDALFDAVVACDVLEHVVDLHRACSEIARVLRPGGTLVVRVPYLDDLDAYLAEGLGYEFIHLRNFDLAGLRLLFEKLYGFTYCEDLPVAYYLKGAPRMKLRVPTAASPIQQIVRDITDPNHPLWPLKQATAVTEDILIQWIYKLRDEHPAEFARVAPHLVHPLEINVVFRKHAQAGAAA